MIMTQIERTSFENQILKNVTLKFAITFIVGSFVFGLTVSGAIYRYIDNIDKRFNKIEKKFDSKELSDYYRRQEIDMKFKRLSDDIQTVQQEHLRFGK